jgi:hypothetical protein
MKRQSVVTYGAGVPPYFGEDHARTVVNRPPVGTARGTLTFLLTSGDRRQLELSYEVEVAADGTVTIAPGQLGALCSEVQPTTA